MKMIKKENQKTQKSKFCVKKTKKIKKTFDKQQKICYIKKELLKGTLL